MCVLISKDEDLSSCFDKIIRNNYKDTSLKELLIVVHTTQENREKVFGTLHLERLLELRKTFKKIPKGLTFHLTFKTAVFKNLVQTTLPAATVTNVQISHLHLFVPMLIPSPETQSNFNNSIRNSFTFPFDSWTTGGRVIDRQLEYQFDIGSAHDIQSPKFLVAAHQTS